MSVVVRFRPLNSKEQEVKEAYDRGDPSVEPEHLHLDATNTTIRDDIRGKVYADFDEILVSSLGQVTGLTVHQI